METTDLENTYEIEQTFWEPLELEQKDDHVQSGRIETRHK